MSGLKGKLNVPLKGVLPYPLKGDAARDPLDTPPLWCPKGVSEDPQRVLVGHALLIYDKPQMLHVGDKKWHMLLVAALS